MKTPHSNFEFIDVSRFIFCLHFLVRIVCEDCITVLRVVVCETNLLKRLHRFDI